jgi:hypothetical protein
VRFGMDGDKVKVMSERPGSLHELAARVFAASPGDSLGLRYDPESQLMIADAMAASYTESLDPILLHDWQAIVGELEQEETPAWPGELVRQLRMHRLMLNMVSKMLVRVGLDDGATAAP